jgi:hypothetical protein
MLLALDVLSSNIRFQHVLPYRLEISVFHDLGLSALHRRLHHSRSQLVYLDRFTQAQQHVRDSISLRQHKSWSANECLEPV